MRIDEFFDRQEVRKTELTMLGFTYFQCYDCDGLKYYFLESHNGVKTKVECRHCDGRGFYWVGPGPGQKYFDSEIDAILGAVLLPVSGETSNDF